MKYYYLDNMRVKVCESLDEWTNHMRGVDPVIARTQIECVTIKTHFLATGYPYLFQTVIYGGTSDGTEWHYTKLGQAKCGHNTWCEIVKCDLGIKL